MIRVALIGNPNVGKSLIFNNLTGGKAHVGNWPGKTVEKKVGECIYNDVKMEIIDLPGTYSLTANSIDELIARDYIIKEKPDVVVDIVDASNLERNLYLTLQLLELEANVVIALNKFDISQSMGLEIDYGKLSDLLRVPVIPTVATTMEGMDELKEAIVKAAMNKEKAKPVKFSYGRKIDELIAKIEEIIRRDEKLARTYPPRWIAIKVLEADEEVLKIIEKSPCKQDITNLLKVRR